MPVTFEFDGRILVLRLAGIYSLADIRAGLIAALAEPHAPVLNGILVDVRDSQSLATRTLGDMTSTIGFLAYHAASYGSRVALVVEGDQQYAVVRMAAEDLHTAGIAASVFRDAGEARRWIQPPPSWGASSDANAAR
jgi:predicted RNA methylase